MSALSSLRHLLSPKPVELSGIVGLHQVDKKTRIVKFAGGLNGEIDNFGLVNRLAGGLTDKAARHGNEDGFLLASRERWHFLRNEQKLLMAVADGMGGYGEGEIASATALNIMAQCFCQDKNFQFPVALDRIAYALDQWKAQNQAADREAGTTLVSGLINLPANTLQLAHLGDSRAYLFRGGELMMLTKDDNLMSAFISQALTEGYAKKTLSDLRSLLHCHDLATTYEYLQPPFPGPLSILLWQLAADYYNAPFYQPQFLPQQQIPFFGPNISKALGVGNNRGATASYLTVPLQERDIVLLASDGLHDFCTYHELAAVLAANQGKSPLDISSAIYSMLVKLGTMGDNVTLAAYKHG